jgi:hypothetical protein
MATFKSRPSDNDQIILSLILKELTNKQIGNRLSVSEHAVKTNLKAIYKRIGVKTRLGAGMAFYRWKYAGATIRGWEPFTEVGIPDAIGNHNVA